MMNSVSHAFGPQGANRGVADGVRRQPRDVVTVEAEVREADADIGFTAAEGGREHRRLQKPLEPGRAQAKHDFAERDDFESHDAWR